MRALAFHKSRLLVVFALICALASSGFAHRFAGEPLDPALASYVAQGGALADICGLPDGSSRPSSQNCEACRLVNSVLLPELAAACAVRFDQGSTVQIPRGSENLRTAKLDLVRAARGPPAD